MEEEQKFYTIILRHDSSTQWMINNPTLALGEYGVEDDTHRVKRGDGLTVWSALPYEEFGLKYMITYANLSGDPTDNEELREILISKVAKETFSDVNSNVVSGISVAQGDESICKITRLNKDVNTSITTTDTLIIKSPDNSIQGFWSIDEYGVKTLRLTAESTIDDYTPGMAYNVGHIIYHDKKLYRAKESFIGPDEFDPELWVPISSMDSGDITYDNTISGLTSKTVKKAIDELQQLDSDKVIKTRRPYRVYGTDENGDQYLYDKDELRTVDTVNGVTADEHKNIQIDATQINYDDEELQPKTIKQAIDSKVDKNVAGSGNKIVRQADMTYDSEDGTVTLTQTLMSLEDGSVETKTQTINVGSDAEIQEVAAEINARIDDEVETLNSTIEAETTVLNERIDDEVETLNTTISTEVQTLNTRIDTEVQTLNDTIDTEVATLNATIDNEVDTLNDRIDEEVSTLNTTITTKETNLQNQINTNAQEITRVETESQDRDTTLDEKIDTEVNTLNTRVDTEVETLNTTITTKESTINDRIDTEVATINDRIDGLDTDIGDRIDTEVATLNTRIDTEVETLNTTIDTKDAEMDTKKVDKDIATGIVTEIVAATESNEPTLKVVTKNTTTKTATTAHLHFKAQGQIQTRFQDADHIVIDSTNIDNKNNQQDTRLTAIEGRLDGHDTDITDLYAHDSVHDRTLGQHASQIQTNAHDILDLQSAMSDAEYNITRLQSQTTTQEAHLTSLDQDIADINDDIVATNRNVSRNTDDIATLTSTKANKTFASRTNNKVIGTINTSALENNEIIKFGITSVDPSTETTSNSVVKVISSDNTIIATRDSDTGVIDLKANLDTDVNYFVTTEILSTTIPSENIIPLNTLTPTDKINVEVHDIISDPEGTWARVESINSTLQTCVAVTFKKHAQAVWGTIKGDILDQQDLQAQFSGISTDFTNALDAEVQARELADNTEAQTRADADDILQGNIDVESQARANADLAINNRLDNLTSKQIQVLTTEEKEEGGYPDASIKQALYNIQSVLDQHAYAYANRIRNYIQGDYYEAISDVYTWDLNNNNVYTAYTIQNYVTFERNDGVVLMAKIVHNFTADDNEATTYESLIRDVELGHLKLIGIPEQEGDDEPPTPEPYWDLVHMIDIQSVISNDGYTPTVNIYQDLNETGPTCGIEIVNNSGEQNLMISGLYGYDIEPNSSTGITDNYEYTYGDIQTEQDVLSLFTFEFVTPEPPEKSLVYIDFIDENSQPVNIPKNSFSDSVLHNETTGESYIPVGDVWTLFEDIPTGQYYTYSGECQDYNITSTSILVETGLDEQRFSIVVSPKSTPSEDEQAYGVLNQVLGESDSYDGLGGTEEEVEAVLDEILGNEPPTPQSIWTRYDISDGNDLEALGFTYNSDNTQYEKEEVNDYASTYIVYAIELADYPNCYNFNVVAPSNTKTIAIMEDYVPNCKIYIAYIDDATVHNYNATQLVEYIAYSINDDNYNTALVFNPSIVDFVGDISSPFRITITDTEYGELVNTIEPSPVVSQPTPDDLTFRFNCSDINNITVSIESIME